MRIFKHYLLSLFLLLSLHLTLHAEETPSSLIKAMQSDGYILMIRHAYAPGFGDPSNIQIGNCATQRNLDNTGRKQSTQIGKWLRSNQIKPSNIYSSQWCRCLETAKLLDLGKVQELPSLNSFFQMPENRETDLNKLKQFIADQKIDQKLIMMVTHSVTISAISGQNVALGDGVLLKLNKSAPYEFVSVVKTDQLN